jgi:hypothetical protein
MYTAGTLQEAEGEEVRVCSEVAEELKDSIIRETD